MFTVKKFKLESNHFAFWSKTNIITYARANKNETDKKDGKIYSIKSLLPKLRDQNP